MTDFSDKTIVITGASRGIGEATAYLLGQQGAHVILAARSATEIKRIADAITADGGQASIKTCDVSNYNEVQELIDFAIEKTGSIDALVNNAGVINPIDRLADSDPEAWAKTIDINYKGVYFGLRAAIPAMIKGGGGTIINISSGAATRPVEGWSHYCSAKAATLMLTRCADEEYADQGINVIGLSPGTVATGMQKSIKSSGINPVSQLDWSKHIPPEWVAKGIAYLCGPEGAQYRGTDFTLKSDEEREKVGLPPVSR